MKLPSFFYRPLPSIRPKTPEQKSLLSRAWAILGVLALSAIAYGVLKLTEETAYSMIVLMGYMAITLILGLSYVIYNRGFSRNGITKDMLPKSWSEEKKQEFVDSAKERLRASKWILTLLIPFIITFALYAFELFFIDMIKDMFNIK